MTIFARRHKLLATSTSSPGHAEPTLCAGRTASTKESLVTVEAMLSLLDSLPEILASLDADALETRAHGALDLARLVDATYDADAAMVAEYLRESGAVELIAELLSDPEPYVHQKILMIVCNLSSDAYDSRSHDTKALLRENEVIARLRPHLLAPPEDWGRVRGGRMQNLRTLSRARGEGAPDERA